MSIDRADTQRNDYMEVFKVPYRYHLYRLSHFLQSGALVISTFTPHEADPEYTAHCIQNYE